jgi:periplasmic divalent cation tolerance protein
MGAIAVLTSIDSVYAWQGAVQSEPEYRVLAKTVAERYDAVEAAILELHSYDLPAIYALDVAEIYSPYADWVARNSSGAPS